MTNAAKQTYTYTAFTSSSDGAIHQHIGTLAGAKRAAIKYARDSFGNQIAGYGPKIRVADASGAVVIDQRI